MKILEVNKFFYPRRGAERHFLDVIGLLHRQGHTVEVFSMRHKENLPASFERYFPPYVGYNASDSTKRERFFGMGRLFWSFAARKGIERLLSEWQPDVAHLHNIYHQLSPSVLWPLRRRGIPILMTVHDYNLVSPDKDAYYPEIGRRYWKFLFVRKYGFGKRLLLVLKKYWEDMIGAYRHVDHYIAPSIFVKEILVRAGLPAAKITVLPHFITPREIPSQTSGEAAYPDQPFVLYAGSLSKEKSTDVLCDVFDVLRTPLVLAGGPEGGFLPKESPYVRMIGQQSKAELEKWMARATCVVSASRLPETFGLIALETIALGKPFFGFRSGAYTEIIKDGKNGYLAENEESFRIALKDFFSGKMTFDLTAIQEDAYARFGEERYAKAWEVLFDSQRKKE